MTPRTNPARPLLVGSALLVGWSVFALLAGMLLYVVGQTQGFAGALSEITSPHAARDGDGSTAVAHIGGLLALAAGFAAIVSGVLFTQVRGARQRWLTTLLTVGSLGLIGVGVLAGWAQHVLDVNSSLGSPAVSAGIHLVFWSIPLVVAWLGWSRIHPADEE